MKLVDLVKETQGATIFKSIKETSPLEAAIMTMHSAMFTRDAIKKMEVKLHKLEAGKKDMTDEINKLSIGNTMLRGKLEGQHNNQNKAIILHTHVPSKKIDKTIDNKEWTEEKKKYEKEI